MGMKLSKDFLEFLKLLGENKVEYLLIGGYAVGHYGYPRYTGDMDIWVAINPANVDKIIGTLHDFGFSSPDLVPELFFRDRLILRFGVEPYRLEICNKIDGVEFSDCYLNRKITQLESVEISLISLEDLKTNKRASGRNKDLADLENLP